MIPRHLPHARLSFVLFAACLAFPAKAAVIFQESFDTDATGSGENYAADAALGGSKLRTGFTGAWVEAGTLGLSTFSRTRDTSINVVGVNLGADGKAEFSGLSGSGTPTIKGGRRDFSYTAPTEDVYLSFKWTNQFNTDSRITLFDSTGNSRNTVINLLGSGLVTSDLAGSNANEFSINKGIVTGANLLVMELVLDNDNAAPGVNPNVPYYDYYRLWVNPTINPAGETADEKMGTPDATGYAILRKTGGGSTSVAWDSVEIGAFFDSPGGARLATFDDIVLTNDLDDILGGVTFAIPEPTSLLSILMGLLLLRRRILRPQA